MPSVNIFWKFTPPPGLTPVRQLPHKWQQATMERLQKEAQRQAEMTTTNIKSEWLGYYQEGWGTVPKTLRYDIKPNRTGLTVSFRAAGRELRWLTTLAGGLFEAGQKYVETPNEGPFMTFFWKRKKRWAQMIEVESGGWDTDLLSEMFELQGREFQSAMRDAYHAGASELLESFGTPKPVGPKTRRNF